MLALNKANQIWEKSLRALAQWSGDIADLNQDNSLFNNLKTSLDIVMEIQWQSLSHKNNKPIKFKLDAYFQQHLQDFEEKKCIGFTFKTEELFLLFTYAFKQCSILLVSNAKHVIAFEQRPGGAYNVYATDVDETLSYVNLDELIQFALAVFKVQHTERIALFLTFINATETSTVYELSELQNYLCSLIDKRKKDNELFITDSHNFGNLECAVHTHNDALVTACINAANNQPPHLFANALHEAAKLNNTFAIRALLAAGAIVDKGCQQDSPLLMAASTGNYEAAKLLINHEADVNYTNAEGVSPLYLSAQDNYLLLAKLLLEHGVLVDNPLKDGRTPLLIACANGHEMMAALLIANKADLTPASDHTTALDQAVLHKQLALVKLLYKSGTNLTALNKFGISPHACAVVNKDKELVDYLNKKICKNGGVYQKVGLFKAKKDIEINNALRLLESTEITQDYKIVK